MVTEETVASTQPRNIAAEENPMLAAQAITAGTAGFGRDATPVSANLTRQIQLDQQIKSGSFLDGPDAPSAIQTPDVKFNPLKPLPKTQEELFKEHALHKLAAMEMPNYLDAPEGEFEKWAEAYDDVSLNVLEEMISNRQTRPVLTYETRPDGTQTTQMVIDYVRPTGKIEKRIPLSDEDILMIGSETGMKSQRIYEYQLGEMQKNIQAKHSELAKFELEMKELKMDDTPAYDEVYKMQQDLINDMLDRYEATYKEYENYLQERGITP